MGASSDETLPVEVAVDVFVRCRFFPIPAFALFDLRFVC